MIDLIAGLLILIGAGFALVAAIGVVRLPDIYLRMHAATKAGTLGSGVILVALGIDAGELAVLVRAFAGVVFLILTAPIAAHLLGKAAYLCGVTMSRRTARDELANRYDRESLELAAPEHIAVVDTAAVDKEMDNP
jgi:multicomponent Na+:H+ antiporter subunit G